MDGCGDQGVLSEGVPAEADAERISRIPCPGIPFGGGPDQGAAATGIREVHQRVLPWRIPVPGVRTGAARGTCVSGHGELSSALHRNNLIKGGGKGQKGARKCQPTVSSRLLGVKRGTSSRVLGRWATESKCTPRAPRSLATTATNGGKRPTSF